MAEPKTIESLWIVKLIIDFRLPFERREAIKSA
jgi:hypothetical protein